ncbi:hypothetical protein WOLCODRAFT_165704 [Wolfiporia cocos MD-104 SS10]|uniref:C2H2-type domain-containing protein n=1 Tax=Wolfiporia cocos (strain MD-104) TaxID=742152 RepID=A0A2H3IXE2_WOLCO|nr:hypothetical protein WOLCODRAFT_165704 [Wolfiporia cocos MD-104 SS10]
MTSFSLPLTDLSRFELHFRGAEQPLLSPRCLSRPDNNDLSSSKLSACQIHVKAYDDPHTGQKTWRISLSHGPSKSEIARDPVQDVFGTDIQCPESLFDELDWFLPTAETGCQSISALPHLATDGDLLSMLSNNMVASDTAATLTSSNWPFDASHPAASTSISSLDGALHYDGDVTMSLSSGDCAPMAVDASNIASASPEHFEQRLMSCVSEFDAWPPTPVSQRSPSVDATSDASTSMPETPDSRQSDSPSYGSPQNKDDPNNDPNRKYPCRHCDRRFLREYTRKVHEMTHQPKLQHPYACGVPNCTSRFSRQHDRLRHEVLKHGRECPWTCESCGKFFSAEKNLVRHICSPYRRVVGPE